MAGRKPLAPAEQRGPDFVGATPPDMAAQEARARDALALAASQQESAVRAVAQQLGYQLPADCTDPDLIQRDIAANMRRSVEACLEVGRGLLAGLGIVVLAVLFDRITQSYGQRMRTGGPR